MKGSAPVVRVRWNQLNMFCSTVHFTRGYVPGLSPPPLRVHKSSETEITNMLLLGTNPSLPFGVQASWQPLAKPATALLVVRLNLNCYVSVATTMLCSCLLRFYLFKVFLWFVPSSGICLCWSMTVVIKLTGLDSCHSRNCSLKQFRSLAILSPPPMIFLFHNSIFSTLGTEITPPFLLT